MYDEKALKLYVDGSALQNPGHGGYSVIAEFPDHLELDRAEVAASSFTETTNNRMELMAVIAALNYARMAVQDYGLQRVIVISDSEYVCKNQYVAADWKKNKGRNVEGRPMDNMNLWCELLNLRPKVRARVDIVWEKGKKREVTKAVDAGAKRAAASLSRRDFGFNGGRLARTKVKDDAAASMFPAKGQTEVIRVSRYEYKDEGEWKITFDLQSGDGEYAAKYFAYHTANDMRDISRHGVYEVVFNDNPKYPKILELMRIEPVSETEKTV